MNTPYSYTETSELEGMISFEYKGGDYYYSDLEVYYHMNAAEPEIGVPEHIEECWVTNGDLVIYNEEGTVTHKLEEGSNLVPKEKEKQFQEALEELIWDHWGKKNE